MALLTQQEWEFLVLDEYDAITQAWNELQQSSTPEEHIERDPEFEWQETD